MGAEAWAIITDSQGELQNGHELPEVQEGLYSPHLYFMKKDPESNCYNCKVVDADDTTQSTFTYNGDNGFDFVSYETAKSSVDHRNSHVAYLRFDKNHDLDIRTYEDFMGERLEAGHEGRSKIMFKSKNKIKRKQFKLIE